MQTAIILLSQISYKCGNNLVLETTHKQSPDRRPIYQSRHFLLALTEGLYFCCYPDSLAVSLHLTFLSVGVLTFFQEGCLSFLFFLLVCGWFYFLVFCCCFYEYTFYLTFLFTLRVFLFPAHLFFEWRYTNIILRFHECVFISSFALSYSGVSLSSVTYAALYTVIPSLFTWTGQVYNNPLTQRYGKAN